MRPCPLPKGNSVMSERERETGRGGEGGRGWRKREGGRKRGGYVFIPLSCTVCEYLTCTTKSNA